MNERRQQPLPGQSTGAGKGQFSAALRVAQNSVVFCFFVVLTHYEARN